uniref:ribosomal protein S3 n=1 Tax=Stereocaulon dactylophyllum TaxID=174043 RepID=UPI0022FD5F8D|nr:ribosomal protein S3 [Stereocaulon dactylophyllum]WBP63378.1 ribosomal protein S3 [Stereocaulon dactylophyllum]
MNNYANKSLNIFKHTLPLTDKEKNIFSSVLPDDVQVNKPAHDIDPVHKLNFYKTKLNKFNTCKIKVEKGKSNNYVYIPRHYLPANKEWHNSIYAFNNNAIRLLSITDKTLLKLVKGYFNFYSHNLENNIKSPHLRKKARMLSTNRILTSKAELKHTNDKVIITIYIYNRQKKYYLNKIRKIDTIDNIDSLLTSNIKSLLTKRNGPWPSNLKMEIVKNKGLNMILKIDKQKKIVLGELQKKAKTDGNEFKNYETRYLKYYAIKSLRKEILSTYIKQLICFNQSKFQERYLKPLLSLVNRTYNKKIEFNFVNLKYLYLNSYIFSETLVTKLRNRNNKLLKVLKKSLLMFKLPSMDRWAVYNEIYNRKRTIQNLNIDSIISDSLHTGINTHSQDILESLLSNVNASYPISNLKDYKTYEAQGLMHFNYPYYMLNSLWKIMKNKYVTGIRVEAAGRLSKRNVASRSLFKLRYIGNIKNMDSSYKGLSTVLLRGYEKSNLQYTKLKSHIRIGSFGIKGWISS